MTHDVIVVGAGPAGASAAIEAAQLGLHTVLIDEQDQAGGQVWRAPSAAVTETPHDQGADLRARLHQSGAVCAFGRRVWLVERGFTVAALGPDQPETFTAPALIVATGAQERHVPVPGWTLPGVIGLAAATILLKSQRVLPGRRVVVAGTGPLLLLVAAEIVRGGGRVAAVIDANRARGWAAHGHAMLSRPSLAVRGAAWLAVLLRAGVPILSAHALRRIEGTDKVTHVAAGPVTDDHAPAQGAERVIECDAVCFGFGLQPATEITRLLGADHAFMLAEGGWAPITSPSGGTSIPGLYVCGDGAGVLGAAAAPVRGQIAAIAIARDLGRPVPERRLSRLSGRLQRTARFGTAMTTLAMPRSGLAGLITHDTIICRCEGLPRMELDKAIAQGADTLNDLKSATRCGMGPCGGRNCEYAASLLIASRIGQALATIAQPTARPPLRPVPLQALAGSFDYASLPMPEPAPL